MNQVAPVINQQVFNGFVIDTLHLALGRRVDDGDDSLDKVDVGEVAGHNLRFSTFIGWNDGRPDGCLTVGVDFTKFDVASVPQFQRPFGICTRCHSPNGLKQTRQQADIRHGLIDGFRIMIGDAADDLFEHVHGRCDVFCQQIITAQLNGNRIAARHGQTTHQLKAASRCSGNACTLLNRAALDVNPDQLETALCAGKNLREHCGWNSVTVFGAGFNMQAECSFPVGVGHEWVDR